IRASSRQSNMVMAYFSRPDEEVVVDQGGTSSVMNIHYEKEELEGENYLYLENWRRMRSTRPMSCSPSWTRSV
uniref:Uncharacterized protein n=1 Tax=Poecilia mexicana TaxID=48701 RepID=A0A3B3Y3G3_9TELE